MNRTLSLEDYVTLANSKLQEKLPHAILRPATPQDATGIETLTQTIPNLDYPLSGIQAILTEPANLNYVIAQAQSPTRKDREPGGYSPLLSFSLAYPAPQFPKILNYMPWKPSETPPEHNDQDALWLELKITDPKLQGQGVYRIIRTMQEIAAYKQGYNKIYLQSFSDAARDIHLNEGYQLLRTVQLTEPGHEDHDEYLMRLDLNEERHQKNKAFLETADKPQPAAYHPQPVANPSAPNSLYIL